MGPLGFHLEKTKSSKNKLPVMSSRGFLATKNLVVVSKRGMSVPIKNWKRPAMEELPVPSVPWNQVMPGIINKNRLIFWTSWLGLASLWGVPEMIFGINPLYNGGTPYHVFPKGNDLSKMDD